MSVDFRLENNWLNLIVNVIVEENLTSMLASLQHINWPSKKFCNLYKQIYYNLSVIGTRVHVDSFVIETINLHTIGMNYDPFKN